MLKSTLALIAALIVLSTHPAVAQSPREIAEKVMPSVVLLMMQDQHGQPLAMASGFVVRDGIVATNFHAIEGAESAYARLVDQKPKGDEETGKPWEKYQRQKVVKGVVASDPEHDLVLLAVDGLKAVPLTVVDSEQVAIGDEVYVVGNPQGLVGTFSAGIVSGIRKVGEDSLLQITAPISPGSSGGPVLNTNGEVIGVAVATFKGGQNLNFAIPSRYLSTLISLIKAPVALAEVNKTAKPEQKSSILDDLGGSSTDGVEASDFLWDVDFPYGLYTFSLRNKLREPVNNVMIAVIFYNPRGEVLDFDLVNYEGTIPGGLAKRVKGEVDDSVQELTSNRGERQPRTKLEYRILYFDIVSTDESSYDNPKPWELPWSVESKVVVSNTSGQAEESLADLERKLAETVAKFAPAGDGPDLIESRIEGEFEGWDGETIFKLANGQIWQQVSFAFTYHYAFRPKVTIIKTHGAYKMVVHGVSRTIYVNRLK